MHWDLVLDQEMAQINEQQKREVKNHEVRINLMRLELQQHQQYQQAREGEISELKALVAQLIGQVKGKGKASDPTPEASGAGGRNPP